MRRKELAAMAMAAVTLFLLAWCTTLSASRAPALPPAPTLHVRVRVDARAVEAHVRLADLARDVRAIWQPYADLVFTDLADPAGEPFDDEVQLVISDRPGFAAGGGSALGWINFLEPGRPGNFVTVSLATARSLMAGERSMGRRIEDLPPALRQQYVTRAVSWSAAHEIGHYLLRTSAHSPRGLMRARLTAAEIVRNERQWLMLEPREAEAIRNRASRDALVTTLRVEPSGDAQ
jgi:hypothetical protein